MRKICGSTEEIHRRMQKLIDTPRSVYYNLTFADKTDEKRPQIQYLCWFAALLSCHFFIVFFLFFCLCQNFFYFSQSSNAFAEIDIHGCPDIF